MDLSNILKIHFKNYRSSYFYFTIFSVLIMITSIVFKNTSDNLRCLFVLVYILASLIFTFIIGNLIFGSFGKTYLLIQNNRKNYFISSIFIDIINAIILSVFFIIIRLFNINEGNLLFDFRLLIVVLLSYLLIFSIGMLYGLFVKNAKKFKRYFIIFVFALFSVLGYFIYTLLNSFVTYFLNDLVKLNHLSIIIIMCSIMINIIINTICFIYYLKMNTIKVYLK